MEPHKLPTRAMMLTSQRKAELLLVATTCIAACGWIFSREALQGMPVLGFLGIRFLLAGVVLLLCCRPVGLGKAWLARKAVCSSSIWLAASMLLWIYAVAITASLGEGAFIMSLSMLFVPLMAWVMLRTRPVRAFWWALPVAVSGLALLTLRQGIHIAPSQLLFFLAAIVQAVYFCANTKSSRLVPPVPLAAVQLTFTGLLALLLSWGLESWHGWPGLAIWDWLIASALVATSLRFWLQLSGQRLTTAASAALIMLLEPLLTVVAAALWYHERMALHQIMGGVLILFALGYYRWQLLQGAHSHPR